MRSAVLATWVTALTLACASSAIAGGTLRDRVHADSYGNLVIHSPAGYKRIIVGMGHTAQAYERTGSYHEPEVVYLNDKRPTAPDYRYCTRQPHVWVGRSHMYGLEAGMVPQAPLVCR
ncbi:hypothetical protein [Aquamicrobium zhengzhouense]|uniref:Lectin-like protein BA14k n=1 Tax=Aquamicrobium zhengzhouense TaxID=2781738 RepID=A0ABS0SFK5_9HYPH|nr:hypothetical protein [Aquamicrobium zhengzhouense]MBI1622084.1 hypothetical protein [Aquamicrobium zhengzhouense]